MSTTLTTRDQLDRAIIQLDDAVKTLDAVGEKATPAQLADTRQKTAKVTTLRAQVESNRSKQLGVSTANDFFADGSETLVEGAKAAAPTTPGRVAAPSLSFQQSDLKSLHKSVTERVVGAKAALTSTEVPQAATPVYDRDVWPGLREMTRISDAIPFVRVDGGTVVHGFRSSALADSAGAVDPGEIKPESNPAWEEFTSPIRKLAHWASVQDEIISDYADFFNVVGSEMLGGLVHEENAQLLVGDGAVNVATTGTNLLGIVPATIAAGSTIGSAGTDLDAVVAAMTLIRTTAFVEPTHLVMHPNDWGSSGFATAKDTQGRYLLGDAVTAPKPMLWGMSVWLTTAMTENSALVVNFERACRGWIRESPRLDVAPASGDEFKNNTTLLRAEERLAFETIRPEAACVITAV